MDKINDDLFKYKATKTSGRQVFQEGGEKKVDSARAALQKEVDTAIISAIEADKKMPNLKDYLGARFTLSKGDKPHAMKF